MTGLSDRLPKRRHGPDYYWAQMRRFGAAGFTLRELHDRCRGVDYRAVRKYVRGLAEAGAVTAIDVPSARGGPTAAVRYAVVRNSPTTPAAKSTAAASGQHGLIQQHLWTAMRTLSIFVVRELAATASTETLVIGLNTARYYVMRLKRAGLLIEVSPYRASSRGVFGAQPGGYRLKPGANTGPRPPKIIDSRVFDANLQRFVGDALDGSEVSA